MTPRRQFRRSVLLAAALALAAFAATPARADRCDDVAKQLANQIDGVKVSFKARNIVYMDAALIALSEAYEVSYWSKKLKITPAQLKAAVKKVGNSASAVEKELKAA